jgi:hypothetical protein
MGAIAVGLLVMMYPIMCKIKFETLHHVFRQRAIWVQIAFSVFVNWVIAPFLMVTPSPPLSSPPPHLPHKTNARPSPSSSPSPGPSSPTAPPSAKGSSSSVSRGASPWY